MAKDKAMIEYYQEMIKYRRKMCTYYRNCHKYDQKMTKRLTQMENGTFVQGTPPLVHPVRPEPPRFPDDA